MKQTITLCLLLMISLFSFGQGHILKLSVATIPLGLERNLDGSLDTNWSSSPRLLSERAPYIDNDIIQKLLVEVKNDLVDSTYTLRLKFFTTSGEYGTITFKSNNWKNSKILIDKQHFQKLGYYDIEVAKEVTEDRVGEGVSLSAGNFSFKVVASDREIITQNVLYSLILGAIIGGLFIFFKNNQTRKKLASEGLEKEFAKLQLNSIRSQLNPHFLFNALSGIQNLMNKNETDKANQYLSKFARLTRNVLDGRELISLSQEIALLDDYLQMEQLRFGFKYQINSSEGLDLDNIEIPSMLLQPFVENAVKYGISPKATDGQIVITLHKESNNLVLTVADNGGGFDKEKKSSGLGLQLSESRITLLNSIYKENRFTLDIQSTSSGTNVRLTLTDWL